MRSAKRKPRINATGRNPDRTGAEDRVLIIRRSLWHSPHISALSGAARSLLVELHSMFNGSNNGAIFLSVRDAADRLGFTDFAAAMNAIRELVEIRLATVTLEGSFSMTAGEASKARAYRLNWIGSDGKCVSPDKLPPLDFTALSTKQKGRIAARSGTLDRYLRDQQKQKSAVGESRTLMAESVRETRTEAALRVEESRTQNTGVGQNPPTSIVRESLTHIKHHIPDVGQPATDNPVSDSLALLERCLKDDPHSLDIGAWVGWLEGVRADALECPANTGRAMRLHGELIEFQQALGEFIDLVAADEAGLVGGDREAGQ